MELVVNTLIVLIVAAGLLSMIGPIQWAIWQARRTVIRHKQISLWGFFVTFTFAALLLGAFTAIIYGTW